MESPSPQKPVVIRRNPTTLYTEIPTYHSNLPTDYPNIDPDNSLVMDNIGVLHNLTKAQQNAGESGEVNSPVIQSSHTLTLMGGGQPGSIFAATIDGTVVYESIWSTTKRSLTQAALAVAESLPTQLPYLRCTASGSSILVESQKPTLTITNPPSTLPIKAIQLYLGPNEPLANDTITLYLSTATQTFQGTVVLNGQELLADQVLQKVLNTFVVSGLRNIAQVRSWFIQMPAESYMEIIPFAPIKDAYVVCKGRISLIMNPQVNSSNYFSFVVS